METSNNLQRSELWHKIYAKVKELPRMNTIGDAVDHPSLTTTLEEMFLKEIELKAIVSAVNDTNSPQEDIKEIIMAQYKKGNIVVATFDGIQAVPLKEFVKQPVDGMLYDLNRSEEVVLTFIKDPKWVNDYAVATVIRELKQQLDEKTSKIGDLIQGEYYIEAKIVTGGMFQGNDSQKLIERFKAHGFKFKGEPITQDNGTVHWTFMEKNNGLINED